MYVSIKALEINTSVVFLLITLFLCLFLFLLIIDLHFIIPAAIGQILNPTYRTRNSYYNTT